MRPSASFSWRRSTLAGIFEYVHILFITKTVVWISECLWTYGKTKQLLVYSAYQKCNFDQHYLLYIIRKLDCPTKTQQTKRIVMQTMFSHEFWCVGELSVGSNVRICEIVQFWYLALSSYLGFLRCCSKLFDTVTMFPAIEICADSCSLLSRLQLWLCRTSSAIPIKRIHLLRWNEMMELNRI